MVGIHNPLKLRIQILPDKMAINIESLYIRVIVEYQVHSYSGLYEIQLLRCLLFRDISQRKESTPTSNVTEQFRLLLLDLLSSGRYRSEQVLLYPAQPPANHDLDCRHACESMFFWTFLISTNTVVTATVHCITITDVLLLSHTI